MLANIKMRKNIMLLLIAHKTIHFVFYKNKYNKRDK
jgi:hypothetical protein